jgi:cysteinyl-tRNA synthetase
MAEQFLGPHFDIHLGGMDLMFPHHENEIAQSEAAWGAPFSKLWLHLGFLNVDKEKMSKSLGNFVTIEDVLGRNDPEALRYYFLGTHYRGPLQFELEKLEDGRVIFPSIDEAERRVEYLYNTRDALVAVAGDAPAGVGNVLQGQAKIIDEAPQRVLSALDKDLNTPQALAVIADLAKAANEGVARQLAARAIQSLDGACKPLGLMQAPSDVYARRARARRLKLRGLDAGRIDRMVHARAEARASKDFARADVIRKELDALGIEILDAGGDSSWRVKA